MRTPGLVYVGLLVLVCVDPMLNIVQGFTPAPERAHQAPYRPTMETNQELPAPPAMVQFRQPEVRSTPT
jgi:hypothetical protein